MDSGIGQVNGGHLERQRQRQSKRMDSGVGQVNGGHLERQSKKNGEWDRSS